MTTDDRVLDRVGDLNDRMNEAAMRIALRILEDSEKTGDTPEFPEWMNAAFFRNVRERLKDCGITSDPAARHGTNALLDSVREADKSNTFRLRMDDNERDAATG